MKPMQKIPRHLLGLIAAFAIATASFVGSALYADSQLATITHRSHQVSDNSMPSLFRLGVIRRESAEIRFLVDEATKGRPSLIEELPARWAAVDEARRAYELLPWWPEERDLWLTTRADLDHASADARTVETLWAEGRAREVGDVVADFDATMQRIDTRLHQLLRINREQGERVAAEADELWRRARVTSLALCGLSVVLTAVLALNAFRNARRFERLQRERADELEAFAGRVAHDLRGPLMPVKLSIQSVERSLEEGDVRRRALERGGRSLLHLERLVADLLTFARAGADPDRQAAAPLREVVSEVVHDLEPQAHEGGVRIAVEDLPECALACAPGVLSSILLNLVGNSLKHMKQRPSGNTVVLRGSREGRRVHVEVADTGGLPAGDPNRLFQPYVRVNVVQPGLGLGLATVRRLVEAHGGIVGARSSEGSGAVFWFDMPAARPDAARA
jgi:signal transduction histidine kinase